MFDLNRRYNRPIVPPIVPPIEDQTCTLQSIIPTADLSKIDRRGHESPSGYGPLVTKPVFLPLSATLKTLSGQTPTDKSAFTSSCLTSRQ